MARDTAFNLTITALSPVHIASGSQIAEGYDFIADKEQQVVHVVNDEAALLLADQKLNQRAQQTKKLVTEFSNSPPKQKQQAEKKEQELRGRIADEKRFREELFRSLTLTDLIDEKRRLLTLRDLRENPEIEGQPLVRYTLRGQLSNGNSINEQIKDVFGRAYIPGSSLKGAIRTALGWQLFKEHGLQARPPQGSGRPNSKTADDEYETRLFTIAGDGNAVNRDVWRGLRVSDSTPLDDALMLAPIRISKQARPGQEPFDVLNVEAIPKDSQTTATIHLDEYLLGPLPQRERGLNYAAKADALRGFAAACRERGAALIDAELAYYRERNDRPLLQRFYQDLQGQAHALPETSFMLQLGWGTGWHSKTFDDRLSENAPLFAEIVDAYRLQPQRKQPFAEGDLFPATRKLVLEGMQSAAPLGWVRVDVNEVVR